MNRTSRSCAMLVLLGVAALCGFDADVRFIGPAQSATLGKPLVVDGYEGQGLPAIIERVRQLRKGNRLTPIELRLHAGTYRIDRSILIDQTIAPDGSAPFSIRGVGGPVIISGARILDDFVPVPAAVRDAALEHAPDARIVAFAMPADDIGSIEPRSPFLPLPPAPIGLTQGDRPLSMARWPQRGYERAPKPPTGGKPQGIALSVPADKAQAWAAAPSLFFGGYPTYDWLYESVRVAKVEPESARITLAPLSTRYPVAERFRYAVYNSPSDIDAPGEFAVDLKRRLLFVWPIESDLKTHPIAADGGFPLLVVKSASTVSISGLSFRHTRNDCISVTDSRQIHLSRLVVSDCGIRGAYVRGGSDVTISQSIIVATGAGGVSLSGGDRTTLAAGGHTISDSVILDFGRLARSYSPGVALGGVGQSAIGNVIANAPHAAVMFDGNDHRIVGNDISRVIRETDDSGAIYSGHDWTTRGTVIRDNVFHDIRSYPGANIKGIYLDQMLSGITITGNTFIDVMQPVFIGGGRDNRVYGNLIIRPRPAAIHLDDRGAKEVADPAFPRSAVMRRLKAVPYDGAPYAARYPELKSILIDQPGQAVGNYLGRNLVLFGPTYDASRPLLEKQAFVCDASPLTMNENVGDPPDRIYSGAIRNCGAEPVDLSPKPVNGAQRASELAGLLGFDIQPFWGDD